jgi:D-3-phosphoglycerate dehydrogenase / 2-oxoglutarate reductase
VSRGCDTIDTLILDLLEWIGPGSRPYAETLEAWMTHCPRLPVWEEANQRGLVVRHRAPGRDRLVSISATGAELLHKHRHQPDRRPTESTTVA